ncbi:unnamed protein product [Prunus armeniaca]
MDAEAAVAEVPATEEAAADVPDDEVPAVDPTQAILVEIPSAVTALAEPLPSAPRRPGGIMIRSISILFLLYPRFIFRIPPPALTEFFASSLPGRHRRYLRLR